jgi:hypothetical protein
MHQVCKNLNHQRKNNVNVYLGSLKYSHWLLFWILFIFIKMKKCLLILLLMTTLLSCKKDETTFTKQETYKDIVYRINSMDSNLNIAFMRAVYTETVKGNIQTDSFLPNPGLYNIPATVLTGVQVVLFAESKRGPAFSIEIVDDNGARLAVADTPTHYPANPLHPDQWVAKLTIVP